MSIHTIKSKDIEISVSSYGAELQSLKYKGREFLWQGCAPFWRDRAPNIFPYVARLWEKSYYYDGKKYSLPIHGFIKYNELALDCVTDTSLTFSFKKAGLKDIDYPFEFVYTVKFEICGGTVKISYTVKNSGDRVMYFGAGGHPGFNVPLDSSLSFEDYVVRFDNGVKLERAAFSDDCFFKGYFEPYELTDNCIRLKHTLFDSDAIILKNCGNSVILCPKNGGVGVKVDFKDFTYLGLWHTTKSEAPFVCIEPWSSLPAKENEITDIAKQADLISLDPGKTYTAGFDITPGIF